MYRHIIPRNISDTGSMLGVSKYRNMAEAGVIFICDLFFNLIVLRMLTLVVKVIIFTMLLIPVVIAITGIEDRSLSEYVIDVMRFKRMKGITKYKIPSVYVLKRK